MKNLWKLIVKQIREDPWMVVFYGLYLMIRLLCILFNTYYIRLFRTDPDNNINKRS